jgi:nicotinamidase-related amidase
MDAAYAAEVPVIVVQHDLPEGAPVFAKGSHGWQLHRDVANRPADHRINKTMASAFTGTDLAEWLAANAIDTLTVVGYMTHNCDAATIFHASHAGLKVEFLEDASGALPYENAAGKASAEEIHRVFCTVFHSNFAAITPTKSWIAAVNEGRSIEEDNIYLSNQRAAAKKEAA